MISYGLQWTTKFVLQMRLTPLILLGLRGLVTQMVTQRQRISVLCLPYLYVKSLPLALRQAPRKEMSKTGYHGLTAWISQSGYIIFFDDGVKPHVL